ncbi:zinc-binding dehydrogenase [Persicimonas caeni]|uniref:Zinc-binding dehydrogenase n=1 Tax=Persicimonas caeni TaxID=2292766 RepID=A0A4Y6PTL8_PERCE|nr:bi-domain-containing oxidoreductase [Persicimonas caeni]QDG51676.1 zinc-binding dehydrogenase [Persicimonas caeni]QED32897.1 zinc-binding dehydrogenase [Persicimonas caeni]
MKQVLQSLKTGDTQIVEIPCPSVKPGHLLIQTRRTLVSAGTERMLVEFGQANYLEKARKQPEKVKQVLDKVRTDGLWTTLDAVQSKLDQPLALGYCNAGVVLEVGDGVEGFEPGDRVVSNGAHAEVVNVPKNLCAKIPDGVDFDEAAFTVAASISLQGIRLVQPTLGERFVVTGLGLLGLMAVQLLRAHGCEVLGIDFDETRLKMAESFGADTVNLSAGEDPVAAGMAFSRGRGVDGVLVTASTKSSEPMHQAAQMCRKRGRIVLVGVTGLELNRADFYEKELTFQVSCSYGPGRYETNYEERGLDYPVGFVRWTEQRNFEAVLDMLAAKKLDVSPLTTHHFDIADAAAAYTELTENGEAIGILLEYPEPEEDPRETDTVAFNPEGLVSAPVRRAAQVVADARDRLLRRDRSSAVVGVVGAGNYATRVMLPALQKTGARLKTVASRGGMSGYYAGKKFGFEQTTTDTERLFADPEINALVILTRHDNHARLVEQALAAGKHVFVEKPLAITAEQLEQVEQAYIHASEQRDPPVLMVGFNRRFAPHVQEMKRLLDATSEPKSFIMTVNAGAIPADHWTQDPQVGGGRIIGEGCHFIDLLRFLAGSPITGLSATRMGDAPAVEVTEDKMAITLSFADGSFGTVHYLANGDKSFPKERLEVFCGGGILQLDNFRKLRGFGWPGFGSTGSLAQDKGHANCIDTFVDAVAAGGPSPIGFDELVEVTRASFTAVVQS